MVTIDIIGDTTPKHMIEIKYEKAKNICKNIWDNADSFTFDDIFHDTIYRCLVALDDVKMSQDYMKAYFFKAFRINMVRYYGYSYNKLKSGVEIADALIPVDFNFEDHLDGFGMLDYVENKHGKEMRQMLWDNLTGKTYKELDKIYHTNTYYYLSKLKDEIKRMYYSDICKLKRYPKII